MRPCLDPSLSRAFVVVALVVAGCATGTTDSEDPGGGDIDAGAPNGDADTSDAGGESDDASPSITHDATPQGDAMASGKDAAPPPPDSASVDAPSPADAAVVDASAPDASSPDAESPDSSIADASMPDSSAPDSAVGCASHGYSGALVTFDLSAQPGAETSVAASSTAGGVAAGALARSAALTSVSGSASINSSNWSTASSADPTRYYTFTVTPAASCTITLTSLALDAKSSATGPTTGDVATSVDAFATHSASFAGTSAQTVTLTATSSGAIEVRVYGYGASSAAGTMRLQNAITLSGTVQ